MDTLERAQNLLQAAGNSPMTPERMTVQAIAIVLLDIARSLRDTAESLRAQEARAKRFDELDNS